MDRKIKCWFALSGDNIVYMYDVGSSNVDSIGYDDKTQTLYIRFLDGSLYEYHDVPEEMWTGLANAESKGSFLHWFIKVNDYDYDYSDAQTVDALGSLPNTGIPHPEGYVVK